MISLNAAQRQYATLCIKESECQRKLKILNFKLNKSNSDVINLNSEVEMVKDKNSKLSEKVNRITSLCSDIRRRTGVSSETQRCIDAEQSKRVVIRDAFERQIRSVSDRINELSERKKTYREKNELLGEQLNEVIQAFKSIQSVDDHVNERISIENLLNDIDESMKSTKETMSMDLADYEKKVHRLLEQQGCYRSQIAEYSELFVGLQDRLHQNNEVFEHFKRQMDSLNLLAKTKRTVNERIMQETKCLTRDIKLKGSQYTEIVSNIEKEKSRKDKIRNLIVALETDISRLNASTEL